MILKFSNGKEFLLPDNIEVKERLVEIDKVLNSVLEFHGQDYTVEEYFRETWNKVKTRSLLEKISFYLSKMPEQNGKHDDYIISSNDKMEMEKGVRWVNREGKKVLEKARYVNFSDLKIEDQLDIGLIEEDSIV